MSLRQSSFRVQSRRFPSGDSAGVLERGHRGWRHGRRWLLTAMCCAGMAAGVAAQGISPGDLEGLVATLRCAWLRQDGSPQTQLGAIVNCAVHF